MGVNQPSEIDGGRCLDQAKLFGIPKQVQVNWQDHIGKPKSWRACKTSWTRWRETRLCPSHSTICEWRGQYPTYMGSCSSKPTTLCEICMGLLKVEKPMCNCAR